MDLLSQKSYSIRTTTSADTELSNRDKEEVAKKLTAYYNRVICNRRTKKETPTKISQTRFNDITYGEIPPPTPNNMRNLIINEGHKQDLSNARKKLLVKTQSVLSLETKIDDSNQASCSRNLPRTETESKLTFDKRSNKHMAFQNIDQDKVGPVNADKTTYCRPSTDSYNHDFVYKTIERHARLQGLVRRLVLAREQEKQKVAWYNYINELKNKHRYNEYSTIPTYMPDNPNIELINDYYNTRFTWKQSNPCQNLLQDFYGATDDTDLENHKCSRGPLNYRPNAYESNRYCFPTSSQGRLMLTNRQKPKYHFPSQSHNRSSSRYGGTPIYVDSEGQCASKPKYKRTQSNKLKELNKPNVFKSLSIQTDLNAAKDKIINEYGTDETFTDKYKKISSNVERLKQKISRAQSNVKYCSLSTIDNKLDLLIHSINTFIVEIKSQRISKNTTAVQLSNVSSLINKTKSDTYGLLRNEQIVCGLVQERPRSTLTFNEGKRNDTLDSILYEEMHKSNKVKKDIEDILNKPGSDRPSLHITFDIPTKERATEITDSLSKARYSNVVVEEIDNQDKSMTIAVNTDPLGLLALFRVSTEAMKQILSYMPHIDYYSYLSRLPIPQLSRNEMTHYVCNICGAAFGRPSQLSDHIQAHNLGNSRNCCVCRHVLDMQRHKTGLFACRHCGQRFTRAYCRELHEQECGKRLGRNSDVTSSLLLLR